MLSSRWEFVHGVVGVFSCGSETGNRSHFNRSSSHDMASKMAIGHHRPPSSTALRRFRFSALVQWLSLKIMDPTSDSKWAGVETVDVEAAGIAEKRRGCGGGECKIFFA